MYQENKILTVTAGKEHQLKILNLNDDIKGDIFYSTYCQGFSEVEKIVKENRDNNKDIAETANNIIAFCGERGQGKSSAMLTFSKFLKGSKNSSFEKNFNDYSETISQIDFHVLKRIDPTELENCHSILSVIISRIFHDFKEKLKNESNKSSIVVNELLGIFQQCYRDIDIIKSMNAFEKLNYGYEDDIEKLSLLSDSANIKKDFFDLVDQFLKFICETKSEKILVIQVDDTDLNVAKAYEIVEDIRKYFMIPNVIVLMATNVELLTCAIDQNFQQSFATAVKNKSMFLRTTREMATQYINKLMPGNRRIDLPDIKIEVSQNATEPLKMKYKNDNEENLLDYHDKNGNKMQDLQDLILRFIFEKTGIIFIKPERNLHRIIPNNTRNIANFLSVLNEMKNIPMKNSLNDITDAEIKLRLSNLSKFETFFINTWIETDLGYSEKSFVNEWNSLPIFLKNSSLIYYVEKQYTPFDDTTIIRRKKKGISEANGLDDVLNVLNRLDELDASEKTAKFVFALKTLYSIALNKNIWQQILLERINIKNTNENIFKNDMVLFISGLFGDNLEYLMRRDRSRISRAKGISIIQIPIIEKFYNSENKENELISSALLCDIGGSVRSDNTLTYEFDISNPLLRLVQPFKYIQDTIEQLDAKTNTEVMKNMLDMLSFDFLNDFIVKHGESRFAAISIVPNIELLEKLTLDLKNRRRVFEDYSENINDFYKRIINCVANIDYLCLQNVSFESVENIFSASKELLSVVFEYRNSEQVDKIKQINSFIEVLTDYKNTTTIEILKERTIKTLKLFYSIQLQFKMLDLKFEINSLQELDTNLSKKKTLAEKTCLNHQAKINKMIKSVKGKLEEYI